MGVAETLEGGVEHAFAWTQHIISTDSIEAQFSDRVAINHKYNVLLKMHRMRAHAARGTCTSQNTSSAPRLEHGYKRCDVRKRRPTQKTSAG